MFRLISILGCLLVFTLFVSCKKETVDLKLTYNQKANELIQEVILEDTCACILEIPKVSTIQSSLEDDPSFDYRKKAIIDMNLKNRAELDSLERLGENFTMDLSFLKRKNIKLIKRDSLPEKFKIILKDCPIGILSVSRPVFDKNYTSAIITSKMVGSCVGVYPEVYKFENGKWRRKKTAGNSSL